MNIWEILQVSGKRKRKRKGVIPILRTERSIAPQRIGPAQLLGHAGDRGHVEGGFTGGRFHRGNAGVARPASTYASEQARGGVLNLTGRAPC